MRRGLIWRVGVTLLLLVVATAFLYPALVNYNAPVDPDTGQKISQGPSFLPDSQISLGLDLRGGIQLTLGVEVEKALETQLSQIGQQVMRDALSEGSMITRPRLFGGDRLEFYLAAQGRREVIEEIIAGYQDLQVSSRQPQADGRLRYVLEFSSEGKRRLTDMTVEQAVSTIRNRIDQFGVAEPDVRRQQGENRISIQLPGLDDPKRAVEIIGKTAHLEFRLVREDVDPEAPVLPPNALSLPFDERGRLEGQPQPKIAVENTVALTGEHISNAAPRYDSDGIPFVSLSFDRTGTQLFGQLTKENVGRRLAIVLDGRVHSAPVIKQEIRGDASISGSFTPSQASDLALVLRAGSLPAPVTVLEERTVGPSLGKESIDMGITSAIIGGILVMLFMVVYYSVSGLIANVMLALDILLIMAGLTMFGATLTLPGIAGIVLTLGMAVDANVLVFERIREELRKGLTPLAAVDAGFSRASVAIMDSNLTTIIAAAILYQFGTGPIRGFAVTLTLGILASMFTAIFVSRIVFDIWLKKPGRKLRI